MRRSGWNRRVLDSSSGKGRGGVSGRQLKLALGLTLLFVLGLMVSLRVFLCIGGWLGVVGDAVSEVDA